MFKYKNEKLHGYAIKFENIIKYQDSLSIDESGVAFNLLNKEHKFKKSLDWNIADNGRLWVYNLNYLNILHNDDLVESDKKTILLLFVESSIANQIIIGLEPYPVSLRSVNIIKYLGSSSLVGKLKGQLDSVVYQHGCWLLKNVEYHIQGNHLIENGIALLFLGYYYKNDKFHRAATKILLDEIDNQILPDGAHYERSPMYHKLVLLRFLDSFQLIKNNKLFDDHRLKQRLESTITGMLSWLRNITFESGITPDLNDSTNNGVPSTAQLLDYSSQLGLFPNETNLKESMYRRWQGANIDIIFNIGGPSPKFQAGHSHSDIFSYELCVNNSLIVCDTGISTYEAGLTRIQERKTKSHNTVQIGEHEQNEIWGAFRIGRRSSIKIDADSNLYCSATRSGYSDNTTHNRVFKYDPANSRVIIKDHIEGFGYKAKSFIHFEPGLQVEIVENTIIVEDQAKIYLDNFTGVEIVGYFRSIGFNKRVQAKCFVGSFVSESAYTITPIVN